MLTPFDDYPVHQTPLPLAHAGGGHPDFYDRFWFNGYTEDYYFAVALGIYPNRGIIDAAFAVVHDGWQRSVFASGRMPLDPTQTRVGPIRVDISQPLRVNRVRVDSADLGITADLEFRDKDDAIWELMYFGRARSQEPATAGSAHQSYRAVSPGRRMVTSPAAWALIQLGSFGSRPVRRRTSGAFT